MTNARQYFTGDYLKPEMFKDGDFAKILSEGVEQEIEDKDGNPKKVLNYDIELNGKKITFTPNKTNGNILCDAFGDDDKAWIGKKIKLKKVRQNVFGKMQDTIVVEPVVEKKI